MVFVRVFHSDHFVWVAARLKTADAYALRVGR